MDFNNRIAPVGDDRHEDDLGHTRFGYLCRSCDRCPWRGITTSSVCQCGRAFGTNDDIGQAA